MLLRAAPREELPDFVQPELATRVDSAPKGDDWIHEIKFDGYRVLARKEGKRVKLISRNNLDWTAKSKIIAEEIGKLPCRSILLDGELVVFDRKGISHFQSLQSEQKHGGSNLHYVIFDILHLDGKNLRDRTILDRKAVLADVMRKNRSERLLPSPFSIGHGEQAFAGAAREGVEGIMSKRIGSRYLSKRTKEWLKVKCDNREEFIICGMTRLSSGGNRIGALHLCVLEKDGSYRYVGKVGTGYSEQIRKELFEKLWKRRASSAPVKNPPRGREETIWVKPKLVAQIAFRELTDEGIIRQGVYQGLREDLNPKQVHGEPVQKAPKR